MSMILAAYMVFLFSSHDLFVRVFAHLFRFSRGQVYVVWLCIRWVVQNTNQHIFLIHAGCFHTICVLVLSFFWSRSKMWVAFLRQGVGCSVTLDECMKLATIGMLCFTHRALSSTIDSHQWLQCLQWGVTFSQVVWLTLIKRASFPR
jgi:hypothetical protein